MHCFTEGYFGFVMTFIINGTVPSCNIWRLFSAERCRNPFDVHFPLTQAQMAVTGGLCYLSYSGWGEGRELWMWVWPWATGFTLYPWESAPALSKRSSSEQKQHKEASISRASLAQCYFFSLLSLLTIQLIRVSCEPWCRVTMRCFTSMFFSYENWSAFFSTIEKHSRAGETAKWAWWPEFHPGDRLVEGEDWFQ